MNVETFQQMLDATASVDQEPRSVYVGCSDGMACEKKECLQQHHEYMLPVILCQSEKRRENRVFYLNYVTGICAIMKIWRLFQYRRYISV